MIFILVGYIVLIIYVIIALSFYNGYLDVLDILKEKHRPDISNDIYYRFVCDVIYIFTMAFWPIFVIDALIQSKKGKKNVHKSENQGRDSEGTHKD